MDQWYEEQERDSHSGGGVDVMDMNLIGKFNNGSFNKFPYSKEEGCDILNTDPISTTTTTTMGNINDEEEDDDEGDDDALSEDHSDIDDDNNESEEDKNEKAERVRMARRFKELIFRAKSKKLSPNALVNDCLKFCYSKYLSLNELELATQDRDSSVEQMEVDFADLVPLAVRILKRPFVLENVRKK